MLFPWQERDYQNLVKYHQANKFTALLIYGANHSRTEQLANQLINFMLCLSPIDGKPCLICSSCRLYLEHNHPDYFHLAGELTDEGKYVAVKVEQIRQLIEFAYRTSHAAQLKVIYLPELDRLNLNSSNALLKILEEPPKDCYFIMRAANVKRLLPTVLSRCFKYYLAPPDSQQVRAHFASQTQPIDEFWLNYFAGEPFFTVPFSNDDRDLLLACLFKPSIDNIFALSRGLDLKVVGFGVILAFLLKWLNDLVTHKMAAQQSYFAQYQEQLAALAVRVNLAKLFALSDHVVFLQKWSEHPLNQKLQFENLLFKYQQIYV